VKPPLSAEKLWPPFCVLLRKKKKVFQIDTSLNMILKIVPLN